MMFRINNKIYRNPLLVFALQSEENKTFEDYQKVFVGVGKINATYYLSKAINLYQPDIIINLGTAGSTTFRRGEVVCCNWFIQRDMEVQALGFEKFETPFEKQTIILDNGLILKELSNGICGSGDQFEMEHNNPEYNVIDMEAYALAKVAKLEQIDFLCLKYISDGADGNAAEDWVSEVKKAAKALKKILEKFKEES